MYGILGEAESDTETLKVIIRRLVNNESLPVRQKGFDGFGDLLKKGASHLRLFAGLDVSRFVVCYDADREDPAKRRVEIVTQVVGPSGISGHNCVVVIPVQAIEAWILADIQAVSRVFDWAPRPFDGNPEAIDDPKTHIERLSRMSNKRPRYAHVLHNKAIARYLDLDRVRAQCASFRPLFDFVKAD